VTYADQTQAVESVTSNLTDAVQEFKPDIKADSRPSSRADFLAPSETSTDGLKPEANRLNEQLSALLFSEQKQSEVKGSVPAPSQQELGDTATKILEIVNEEPTTPKLPESKLLEPKLPVVAAEVTLDGGDTPPQVPQPATSSFDAE